MAGGGGGGGGRASGTGGNVLAAPQPLALLLLQPTAERGLECVNVGFRRAGGTVTVNSPAINLGSLLGQTGGPANLKALTLWAVQVVHVHRSGRGGQC